MYLDLCTIYRPKKILKEQAQLQYLTKEPFFSYYIITNKEKIYSDYLKVNKEKNLPFLSSLNTL